MAVGFGALRLPAGFLPEADRVSGCRSAVRLGAADDGPGDLLEYAIVFFRALVVPAGVVRSTDDVGGGGETDGFSLPGACAVAGGGTPGGPVRLLRVAFGGKPGIVVPVK